MKTTIDLPEGLLLQAKVAAARRRTTLRSLIVEGLERVIHSPGDRESPRQIPDDDFFEKDAYGVPVLRRRGATVTDAVVEKLREEAGV